MTRMEHFKNILSTRSKKICWTFHAYWRSRLVPTLTTLMMLSILSMLPACYEFLEQLEDHGISATSMNLCDFQAGGLFKSRVYLPFLVMNRSANFRILVLFTSKDQESKCRRCNIQTNNLICRPVQISYAALIQPSCEGGSSKMLVRSHIYNEIVENEQTMGLRVFKEWTKKLS